MLKCLRIIFCLLCIYDVAFAQQEYKNEVFYIKERTPITIESSGEPGGGGNPRKSSYNSIELKREGDKLVVCEIIDNTDNTDNCIEIHPIKE